jgi:hypothetical protein
MSKRPQVVIVMARCSRRNKGIGVRFEEVSRGHWIANWAFPVNEEIGRREGYDRQRIIGSFTLDENEFPGCPYCDNQSFVRCGCEGLGCWNGESRYYTCPYCGSAGEVGGAVDSLSAGGDR